ncbi:hypothetical protein [Cysteiniphilum sp. JM-1]|uniref:hypothetical protein n=1 Tax=Cysteiniphilum sp. JM-1 TaxID=2610891 RepID=UPI00124638EA|nr:hypothetical protein [Cysteiniphilum sp. JM-1]
MIKSTFKSLKKASGIHWFVNINKTFLSLFRLKKAKSSIGDKETQELSQDILISLGLNEEKLTKISKRFKLYSYLFYLFSLLSIVFMVYSFVTDSVRGGLMSFALTVLLTAYAFKFHFWYFQVRSRKLGVTLKEFIKARGRC